MPSWNNEESSDEGSLLLGFTEGLDVGPRPPCPDSLFCSDYHDTDDSNLCCKYDMPLHKFVAFEGTNTGRKFLGCGCQEEGLCDTVVWKDDEWPDRMQHCLLNPWSLYDEEKRSRLSDNVEYAEKNYMLVLENKDLEAMNVELHKQIGNHLEMAQKATTHELELMTARKEKAEQQVCTLKEEKRKLEFYIADLLKAIEVNKNKGEQEVSSLKLEKRKLEFYIAYLLKAAEVNNNKLKKISEILEE